MLRMSEIKQTDVTYWSAKNFGQPKYLVPAIPVLVNPRASAHPILSRGQHLVQSRLRSAGSRFKIKRQARYMRACLIGGMANSIHLIGPCNSSTVVSMRTVTANADANPSNRVTEQRVIAGCALFSKNESESMRSLLIEVTVSSKRR